MRRERGERRLYVGRSEITLLKNDLYPLAEVPLHPEPLFQFVRVFNRVSVNDGESATVAVDLLPLTTGQLKRNRKRLEKLAAKELKKGGKGRGAFGSWGEIRPMIFGREDEHQSMIEETVLEADLPELVWDFTHKHPGGHGDGGGPSYAERVAELAKARIGTDDTVFRLQILIRVATWDRAKTDGILHSLGDTFNQWAGPNGLHRHGWEIAKLAFLSSAELPIFRSFFDYRMRTGLFMPMRKGIVTASEFMTWVKPPFDTPESDSHVQRLPGGNTPGELERWEHQPDLVPLGMAFTRTGPAMLGARLSDTRLTLTAGKAKTGKTGLIAHELLHLARTGRGCMLLDWHAHNLDRLRPYLTDQADRVVEVNLADDSGTMPAWNVISMAGQSPDDIQFKSSAIMATFSSVMGWGTIFEQGNAAATRAIIRNGVQALLELALVLPPELTPTIFQLPRVLLDDDWKRAAMPFVSPTTRNYFSMNFDLMSMGVLGRPMNLIEQLRGWPNAAALLGAVDATYSARRAMDENLVVLACPAGFSDRERFVANLLAFDLLYSAMARGHARRPDQRRFYAFIEELEQFDNTDSNELGTLLEEAHDHGLILNVTCEAPADLKPMTLEAIMGQRTRIAAGALEVPSARLFQGEWATAMNTEMWITLLERHHFLISAMAEGRIMTMPFQVAAPPLPMIWSHVHDPRGAPALKERAARNLGARPVADTISALDNHDDRVLRWLLDHAPDPNPRPNGGRVLRLVPNRDRDREPEAP